MGVRHQAGLLPSVALFRFSEDNRIVEHSKLKIDDVEGLTVVTFPDLQITSADSINGVWDVISRLILPSGGIRLVLDCSQVRFLSSTALGGLMRIARKVRSSGGELRLCSVTPAVLDVLKLTRMDKVIEICTSREEALRGL